MIKRIFIAAAFALFYISMYPILVGGFVIYVYPYWSPPVAVAWVLGGILVQAWFCFPRSGATTNSRLLTQVGAGILYAASIMVFSGGCYQS
jgi:hypothetical protein